VPAELKFGFIPRINNIIPKLPYSDYLDFNRLTISLADFNRYINLVRGLRRNAREARVALNNLVKKRQKEPL